MIDKAWDVEIKRLGMFQWMGTVHTDRGVSFFTVGTRSSVIDRISQKLIEAGGKRC